MASLNRVQIIGNLTRDPEVKYTPKGMAIAEISLAVNRNYSTADGERREEVTYLEVTFWGKQAEVLGKWMRKGKPLYVAGRLRLDTWEDKESGKKQSRLRITGEEFQFLGGKDGSENKEGIVRELDPPHREDAPQEQASTKPSYEEDFDSIPF